MKLKLKFKSAKRVVEEEVELSAFSLMSLLNDEAIIEISKQISTNIYKDYGCYLSAISDVDNVK
nr:MAG TPA: hypothetical protein [Microviridae sp.]